MIGRFLFGICAGMNLSVCPVLIEETIPARLINKGFGSATAIGLTFMTMVTLFTGSIMPTSTSARKTSQFWRIIFLFSIILEVAVILLNIFVFKYDSLQYMVEHNDKDNAVRLLKSIYPNEKYHIHLEIFNDMKKKAGKTEGIN